MPIHLIHGCIAAKPVEGFQQQTESALVGGRQLSQHQVGQSWLLTAVLNQLGQQPAHTARRAVIEQHDLQYQAIFTGVPADARYLLGMSLS